jgi:predicted extracellular nuclease
MKAKRFIVAVVLAVVTIGITVAASGQKRNTIVFYNLENLFDTIPDPDINDEEFLPGGVKDWNSHKYWAKMANLDKVFYGIAAANKDFPAIIGVSEIENRTVLEDLVVQPKIAPAQYRIVHYDSPDRRGVDVAFLYRADRFTLEGSYPIPVKMAEIPDLRTRDIVTMWGTMDGEPFYFMVSHWPSRLGGQQASAPRREAVAAIMRHAIDSVLLARPETKIAVMGDFNDDPTDKSVAVILGGKEKVKELAEGDMFNPYMEIFKKGIGTLAYQDSWNLFDNIVVSANLVTAPRDEWHIIKTSGNKFYGNTFRAKYLFQQEGQYKGYPLRTFVTNNFQNGYSDHLPVYIVIEK